MANIIAKPQMELTATFSFNEIEIRALDALTGYDFDGLQKAKDAIIKLARTW